MKSLNKYFKSVVSVAGLSGLAVVSYSSTSNANTIQHIRQAISQGNEPPEVIAQAQDTRFTCQLVDGEYTVMYSPESQPEQLYPWAIPSELGGGWTPQKRCDAITRRFEEYRQEGLLELATGTENGYDTICVTTQLDPSDCKLILTVPPGQDPQLTRDLIFDNLLVADDGQQTEGVYTFGDSQSNNDILGEVEQVLGGDKKKQKTSSPENIDLRPFLDPADGGTGQQLTQGDSAAPQGDDSERKPDLFK